MTIISSDRFKVLSDISNGFQGYLDKITGEFISGQNALLLRRLFETAHISESEPNS